MGPVLRQTIWKVFGLAAMTAVVGLGSVLDRSRSDALNQVAGVGAFVLAAYGRENDSSKIPCIKRGPASE